MNRYPLVSKQNLPAYAVVMGAWLLASVVLTGALRWLTGHTASWLGGFVFAAVAVMFGMAIMFAASALNLRKLRPGFKRLADGATDPDIPPVWCPVLTMATRSALELSEAGPPRNASEKAT